MRLRFRRRGLTPRMFACLLAYTRPDLDKDLRRRARGGDA